MLFLQNNQPKDDETFCQAVLIVGKLYPLLHISLLLKTSNREPKTFRIMSVIRRGSVTVLEWNFFFFINFIHLQPEPARVYESDLIQTLWLTAWTSHPIPPQIESLPAVIAALFLIEPANPFPTCTLHRA